MEFRNGQDFKAVESDSENIPVYGSGGVFAQAQTYLHDGESILFGRKGTVDCPLYVNGKFWTVDTMYYTIPRPLVVPKFVYYWATTAPYPAIATQTTVPSTTSVDLGRLQIPLPPFKTQEAITTYLDCETSEIDSMLNKLNDLGQLLEERQQNTVKETLASVSPNAPWVQCKLLCKINTGSGDTQDATEDGNFPFYVRSQTPKKYHTWEFDGEAVLTAGDGAGVGKVFHLANGKFMAHQRVYVLNNFQGTMASYFYHVFKWLFPHAAKDGSAKNTVDSVRQPMIANLKVPLPSLDEQKHITKHLEENIKNIDAMFNKIKELKDLLIERRRALITAAVTGQIEVH